MNNRKYDANSSEINQIVGQYANSMSLNYQKGTDVSIDGMKHFQWKAERLREVRFDQAKGNLFEYIEAAKLNKNMANAGYAFDNNPLTDLAKEHGGFGENTAPDDFRYVKNKKIIGQGQAKVNNSSHKAAVNFVNSKYKDMQRIAPSDQIPDIKNELDKMLKKGEISYDAYKNAIDNMRVATDPQTGISSGGTTLAELEKLRGTDGKISQKAVKQYALQFETKQYITEVGATTGYGMISGGVANGMVAGVQNLYQVYQNNKKLEEAIKDIGASTVKGAAKGGGTGFIGSVLRIIGIKKNIPLISDSSAATVIAGSIIDMGAAFYGFAKDEITQTQLQEEIQNTIIKSTSTIYFTKAITITTGIVNPFIPITIYSIASYSVVCIREIMRNAKLRAEEYRRMKDLLDEQIQLVRQYREILQQQSSCYADSQKRLFDNFIFDFDEGIEKGDNYSHTIEVMIQFANTIGIELQHTDFEDFSNAMVSNKKFVLK